MRKYEKGGTGSKLDALRAADVILGDLEFIAPDEVKHNPAAYRKWREVIKIYQEAGLSVVSSTDCGVIGRYCMLYSEYQGLLKARRDVSDFTLPDDDIHEILATTEEAFGRARAQRLWGVVEYFTRLKGLLDIDRAINAKQKALLDVEDHLFLNPASKARKLNVTTKHPEAGELGKLGFDV